MFQRKVDALNAANSNAGGTKKPTASMMQWEWLKTAKEKWNAKETEDKNMILYIIILFIGFLVAEYGSVLVAGFVVLVLLHLVWLFLSKKTTLFTKVVVYGMLAVLALGAIAPEGSTKFGKSFWSVTKKSVNDAGDAAEKLAARYDKGEKLFESDSPKSGGGSSSRSTFREIIVTSDRYTPVRVGDGVNASFDCPADAMARFFWSNTAGGPIRTQEHDCADGNIRIPSTGPVHNFEIGFVAKDTPTRIGIRETPM